MGVACSRGLSFRAAVSGAKAVATSLAPQRPRVQPSSAARSPEVVAAVRVGPAQRQSGKNGVSCTTVKQGQAGYETADIVCKNATALIHTVYLDIRAAGYSGMPSAAAAQGGYLLAPGESKRVARLKVVSRPATLAVNTRAVPFKALQMPG